MINRHLFYLSVPAPAVGPEDKHADDDRQARDREDQDLRSRLRRLFSDQARMPLRMGSTLVHLGGIEHSQDGRHHGYDDQAAAEADSAQPKLGHPDFYFYLLPAAEIGILAFDATIKK